MTEPRTAFEAPHMKSSIALTEYHIRKPLNSDLRLDALPAELQETAAELLCTIFDAAMLKGPGAIAELRKIASKLAPKPTRNDDFQRDRPLVTQLIERAKATIDEDQESRAFESRVLVDSLQMVDPAFGRLDPVFVGQKLRKRSVHEIAAILTVESGAFGEKPSSGPAKLAAIDRAKKLSLRAKDA